MPHANYASGCAPRSPDKNNQPRIEPTHRNKPTLTVIQPVVDARQMQTRKDFPRSAHIQAAFPQRLLALARVARNAHTLIVATLNGAVKSTGEPSLLANARVERPAANASSARVAHNE